MATYLHLLEIARLGTFYGFLAVWLMVVQAAKLIASNGLRHGQDRLVQFCHGATGMVSLTLRHPDLFPDAAPSSSTATPAGLSTDSKDSHHKELAQQFGQTVRAPRLTNLKPAVRSFGQTTCLKPKVVSQRNLRTGTAKTCCSKVWIRGLLRKGLGLCHGIPGNGFALLKLHPGVLA